MSFARFFWARRHEAKRINKMATSSAHLQAKETKIEFNKCYSSTGSRAIFIYTQTEVFAAMNTIIICQSFGR